MQSGRSDQPTSGRSRRRGPSVRQRAESQTQPRAPKRAKLEVDALASEETSFGSAAHTSLTTPTSSTNASPLPSAVSLPSIAPGPSSTIVSSRLQNSPVPTVIVNPPNDNTAEEEEEGNSGDDEAGEGDVLTASQKREKRRRSQQKRKKRKIDNARKLLLFGCPMSDYEDIFNWDDKKVLEEGAKVRRESKESISKDGRIWFVDLDHRMKRRGGTSPSSYEGEVPDLSDKRLRSDGWTLLTHGITFGYRTNADGRNVLVFAARFQPYKEMTPSELSDMQFMARHLHDLGRLFYPVKNGSLRGGIMFAEGWRRGYEALHRLGLYKLMRNGKGTKEEYAKFIEEMELASDIYAKRYKQLAPREYLSSCDFVEESGVPRFGTSEIDSTGATGAFGCNLTATWGDFWNVYHRDDDASPRAAGLWMNTDDSGNLIMDAKLIREAVQGGLFGLPEYKLAVDFGACPGVVDLMWSSLTDLHATSPSMTQPGFRRVGTSIQVPNSTFNATQKMLYEGPEDRAVAGLDLRLFELENDL